MTSGFDGVLSNIQPIDLIQMVCQSGHSISLRVESKSRVGVIHIQAGSIVHAECRDFEGEEAFFRILGWKDGGKFTTFAVPPSFRPTINQHWESLLLEAARMSDEADLERQLQAYIVDDSRVIRGVIRKLLEDTAGFAVVGEASNGAEAREFLSDTTERVDLVTLDINMPEMDGSMALRHIMVEAPCPVVVISSVNENNAASEIIKFLLLGAVDVMIKPKHNHSYDQLYNIRRRLKHAASSSLSLVRNLPTPPVVPVKQILSQSLSRLIVLSGGVGGHQDLIRVVSSADTSACLIAHLLIPQEILSVFSTFLETRSQFHVSPFFLSPFVLTDYSCYLISEEVPAVILHDGAEVRLSPQKKQLAGKSMTPLLESLPNSSELDVSLVFLSGTSEVSEEGLQNLRRRGVKLYALDPEECIVADPVRSLIDTADGAIKVCSFAEILKLVSS